MKNFLKFFFLISLFVSISQTAFTKGKFIDTGKGNYEVLVSKAKGKGPHPLLLIVPAKKYTMEGKIFAEIAKRAAKLGFYVVRFNWGFITNKDEVSEDLATEKNDLNQVLKYYLKQEYINKENVVILAKSFGSKIAMKSAYKKATSLLLVTPNCDKKNTFRKNYAPIFTHKIKTHIVISRTDPYCNVKQIYRALPALGKKVSVTIVEGDHNFQSKTPHSDMNEETAITAAVNWLNWQIKK